MRGLSVCTVTACWQGNNHFLLSKYFHIVASLTRHTDMAAQSSVATSQWNMTVRPAQMMHPVTQIIQPMLKKGLPSQQTAENKMCEDVLAFSKRKKQQPQNILFFFGEAAWMFFCRMWDERRSLLLLPSPGSHRPRCSPINTDSITMHPTSHSRCWPLCRKEEGRRDARWETKWQMELRKDEHVTGRDCLIAGAVEMKCNVLLKEKKAE